ncbi:Armadillo-like helical [Artemisia annua]|uniref:Armadillo-like helical n=1 Tax=Artemisia annua TaxID=35608 RepID=A0A2U1NM09_ARTAN|nr:Armadillo-like helical [Artemisia annua]
MSQLNGSAQPKDKVKTKINQENAVYGTKVANQLTVVNLAVNQLGEDSLEDLLCIDPFVVPFKYIKKGSVPKVNVAEWFFSLHNGFHLISLMLVAPSGSEVHDVGKANYWLTAGTGDRPVVFVTHRIYHDQLTREKSGVLKPQVIIDLDSKC